MAAKQKLLELQQAAEGGGRCREPDPYTLNVVQSQPRPPLPLLPPENSIARARFSLAPDQPTHAWKEEEDVHGNLAEIVEGDGCVTIRRAGKVSTFTDNVPRVRDNPPPSTSFFDKSRTLKGVRRPP